MATERFILLPREGLHPSTNASSLLLASLPDASSTQPSVGAALPIGSGSPLRIVDTAERGGAQLIEMDTAVAMAVNNQPGLLRVMPLTTYEMPEPSSALDPNAISSGPGTGSTAFTIQCIESGSGNPLAGVRVHATGGGAADARITDVNGQAILTINGNIVERLCVYTEPSHWGAYRSNMPAKRDDILKIAIDRVVLPYRDMVAHHYGTSQFDQNRGVTVGVIDSGVGPHADLNIVGAMNTVTGEPSNLIDDWKGHGTHVAGIIGAKPSQTAGVRGLAPGIAIRSYRVFGQINPGATNYGILKAMVRAEADGCDILNLSLGGGPRDIIVEEAIRDARNRGMLVVIAAGNEGRRSVTFPAAHPGATAVSAMGNTICFPSGSLCEKDILRPPYSLSVSQEFIGGFSNIGPQIAVTAPGVGVISTLPNNHFGVYSGTSMAAPVIVGATACLLSRDATVYGMVRNRARSDAIERLLQSACIRRGFGLHYEGYSMPDSSLVGP